MRRWAIIRKTRQDRSVIHGVPGDLCTHFRSPMAVTSVNQACAKNGLAGELLPIEEIGVPKRIQRAARETALLSIKIYKASQCQKIQGVVVADLFCPVGAGLAVPTVGLLGVSVDEGFVGEVERFVEAGPGERDVGVQPAAGQR